MLTLHLTVHTDPIQECTVQKNPFSIGSDLSNDLVIHDRSAEGFQSKIVWQENQYYLLNQRSPTEISIGGIRVEAGQSQPLCDGKLLLLGGVIIEVKISTFSPQEPKTQTCQAPHRQTIPTRSMRLDAIALNKSSRPIFGTKLLNNISLSFLEKEFIVVAGVSGGGKSTLLDALSGQRCSSGKVLINGCDLYRNYNAFKDKIGYVPQDDIVHLELTVSEALKYASQLRLPSRKKKYRQQRIQEVLEQLQLEDCKKKLIRQLSGGQRKRVSIAVELISNPSLFFLDEATSGLDPDTEWQIMELLKNLAKAGSTVVLITHATKNLANANMVVFLAKGGRLAYFGPSKLALDYFKVDNFDEIYGKVERQLSPKKWEEKFNSSRLYTKLISDRKKTIPQETVLPAPAAKKFNQQFTVLFCRNLAILLKNKISLALMILGTPILGSLNFVLWRSDLLSTKTGDAGQTITMFFVTVIMAVISGSLAMMPEIAKEKTIYRRERSVGLRVIPYVTSKLMIAFVLAIYQSGVLLAFMLTAVKIPGDYHVFLGMYISVFLASFGSMVMGLIVSAIVSNQSVAPLLTIIFLIPQIMFGGGILPPSEFNSNAKIINQLMLTKYPFESLVSLSGIGSDVVKDACWQKSERERRNLKKEEIEKCNCYGRNILKKCNFPGIGRVETSIFPTNFELMEVHLLIQSIFDNYKSIFKVNVTINTFLMIMLIVGLIAILFLIQFVK